MDQRVDYTTERTWNTLASCLTGKNLNYKNLIVITKIRKYSLGSRVVNIWNSLPDYVAEADSVNAFKNRLDKYWTNQDVVYDGKSHLTETGGLPVCAQCYVI